MPFEFLVLSMLHLLRKSLQVEINAFFERIGKSAQKISASAFIQLRKKLNPDVFYDLNQLIVDEFYKDNDENIQSFKSFRLLAIDGSTLHLPFSSSLATHYGTFNNQTQTDDVVLGRVSILYDVLNEMVIDGLLRPFSEGELLLSKQHFKCLHLGDLVIMDRGYFSFDSVFELCKQQAHFIFRCKHNHSNQIKAFYLSGQQQAIIPIKATQSQSFKNLPYQKDTQISVRMIRIELSGGETEVLMTSLMDEQQYPYEDFTALYFKRWKIETFYNRLKNIISVEKFSGTSHQFIQQEFNCALYISNMQTIFTQAAQTELKTKHQNKKYEYKLNQSISLGIIRNHLIEIYNQPKPQEEILKKVQALLLENIVPIRPNRSFARNKDKYRHRNKPIQFKNRKDNG